MIALAKELQPIYRTILGPGIRESMKVIQKHFPSFQMYNISSGTRVFDWEVPPEWHVKEAYIIGPDGKRYADFHTCHLHLVGYSIPVNNIFTLKQLKKHLHYDPSRPKSIPYVTSYYNRTWGFCIDYDTFISLPEGEYQVFIDSAFRNGNLNYIEAVIPGLSTKEISFTSYLCHPHMVNNELSGPVLVSSILEHVLTLVNPTYTYRFAIFPETIGSIAYLQRKTSHLRRKLIAGYHLTCVGDDGPFSIMPTITGNTISDNLIKAHIYSNPRAHIHSFLERRSDERQFNSALIRLPITTFSRSYPGSYPEYHTSDDNFSIVTSSALQQSFNLFREILRTIEVGLFPKATTPCEPNLGKRSLYPTTSTSTICNLKNEARQLLDILSYADGRLSSPEIAKALSINIHTLVRQLELLRSHKLIKPHPNEPTYQHIYQYVRLRSKDILKTLIHSFQNLLNSWR